MTRFIITLLTLFALFAEPVAAKPVAAGIAGYTKHGTELYTDPGYSTRYCTPGAGENKAVKDRRRAKHKKEVIEWVMMTYNLTYEQVTKDFGKKRGLIVTTTMGAANVAAVHMDPMGPTNKHTFTYINGKKVWMCPPDPKEPVWALNLKHRLIKRHPSTKSFVKQGYGKFYPLLVLACGNLSKYVDFYKNKKAKAKVKHIVEGEGEGNQQPTPNPNLGGGDGKNQTNLGGGDGNVTAPTPAAGDPNLGGGDGNG